MTSNFYGLFANQNPRQNQQVKPQINKEQFKQLVPNIPNDMLVQLARQARAQGISDQDIETGINFIQQFR